MTEPTKTKEAGSANAKPTPGPWAEGNMGEVEAKVVRIYGAGEDGPHVADTFTEANARLIAAAPALAEALNALLAVMQRPSEYSLADLHEAEEMAEAALEGQGL